MTLRAAIFSVALLGTAAAVRADLSADQTPFHTYRGMWLDRFDYSNATNIATAFQRAQTLGITDVMFQVRGQADAYYYLNDGVETYPAGKGISAAYDPLQIAINEGRSRGIKVHAWVNMMPLWLATTTSTAPFYSPSAPAGHLINVHDDWWARNSAGSKMPFPANPTTGYVIVNPTRDDVQAHLNNVVKTIAKNYAVDGIHMDYIRLYADNTGALNPIEFPSDAETTTRFQVDFPGQRPDGTGPTGTPAQQIANFKAWSAAKITKLVSDIRTTTNTWRPGAQLTAAVWRDSSIGLNGYQQDWATWVDQGLLDAAMPMIYRKGFGTAPSTPTHDADPGDLYRLNTTSGLNLRGNAGIMPGLGTYMQNDPDTAYNNVMDQLQYAKAQGANGIQFFDYGTLYTTGLLAEAQAQVRQAFTDFFTANRTAPAQTAITSFDADEGYFNTSITASGSNSGVAASSTADRVTTQAQAGPGSQRIVINKTAAATSFLARHLSGIGIPGDLASNLQFPSIGSVGFWLKTTSPDIEVSFAADDNTAGTERGFFKNVIADGMWHKYEWFLADVTHWDNFSSGNGQVANIFATDSIQFRGTGASNELFLDSVFYDAAAVAPNQWVLDANGTWGAAGNWNGPVPNGVGAVANLLRRGTAPRTITLGAVTTLGSLTFDNSFAYTIAGSSNLTLDVVSGNASVNVINRGAPVISAPVNINDPTNVSVDVGAVLTFSGNLLNNGGRTLTKSGGGEWIISGAQSHGAGAILNINEGKTTLASNSGPQATPRLSINVNGGASLAIAAIQNLNALNLTGNASATVQSGANKVVKTNSLTLSPLATLDLTDNDAIVQASAANRLDVLNQVSQWVASARNGVAGKWRGPGITSSIAAADGRGITGIGAILNDDGIGNPLYSTFDGQSVNINSILLKFTYVGDGDLDGDIDADDYARIDAGFAGRRTGYGNGDFDYSGTIDPDDFFLIDRAFANQSTPLAALSAQFASVPEPTAFAGIAAAVLLLARRRRGA